MKNRFTGLVGVLIFLGIVVAINAVLSQTRIRCDFTKEGLYTLSPGTKQLLAMLPREVTLKFYYSKNVEGLPAPLKQYAQRILDLLREYAVQGKGRLALEVLDPKPDSDDEEWAQRYGVTPQNLGAIGLSDQFYLGVVASSGAKEAVIPFFNPGQEPQLEYLLTRLISEVETSAKPKIGIMTALPVMGLGGMAYMQQRVEPWVFVQELKNQYEVVQLSPDEARVPEDISTVLVIHPKNLSNAGLFALDQFVLRGGRLFAFVDPACVAEAEIQPDQEASGMMENHSDLNRLTKAWGFEMNPSKVVVDFKSATRLSFRDGRTERSPTSLSLRKNNLNAQEISSSALDFLFMPLVGAFSGAPAEGLKMTPLVTAAPGSGLTDSMTAAMGSSEDLRNFKAETNALPIALRLAGKFHSAFPDGLAGQTNAAPALKEGAKDGVVVLVGDVDMLYDRFAVRRMSFFGQNVVQMDNDNIAFMLNTTEQLAGNEVLIGLRSRGSYERPFDTVIAQEERAQSRFREEELQLQDKLQAAQVRVDQLERQKDPSQKLVLSPEQRNEVEQFRKEVFETKKQLKNVRKELRSDIESLGLKLKAVNIAAVPALVALFGIAHGLRRRQKALH